MNKMITPQKRRTLMRTIIGFQRGDRTGDGFRYTIIEVDKENWIVFDKYERKFYNVWKEHGWNILPVDELER